MKYKVIVSDTAKMQLASNISFIAKVNKNASRETKNRLIKAFCSLEDFSERYPFFNEEFIPKNKYHKMFVKNFYLILYQIKDGTVYIDFIVDCRQDYSWLMNK